MTEQKGQKGRFGTRCENPCSRVAEILKEKRRRNRRPGSPFEIKSLQVRVVAAYYLVLLNSKALDKQPSISATFSSFSIWRVDWARDIRNEYDIELDNTKEQSTILFYIQSFMHINFSLQRKDPTQPTHPTRHDFYLQSDLTHTKRTEQRINKNRVKRSKGFALRGGVSIYHH